MIELYQQAFSALKPQLPGLAEERAAAMHNLVLPGRRDEPWRYTSVRKLLGELEPVTDTLRGGVLPANSAVGTVATHQGLPGLNLALFREGALITESGALQVHTVKGLSTPRIVVQADTDLELLITYQLDGGTTVPVIELIAAPGVGVSVTQLVVGSTGSFAGHVAVRAGKDSRVSLQTVIAGGGILRAEHNIHLAAGSQVACSGLILGRDRMHADQHVEIEHAGVGCSSSQLFRNLLDDRARAVFTGAVTVAKQITGTDAQQSVKTLLLADTASVVTRPWLEIHNDQVTASHGATVGRLDPDTVFYLRSRGLDVAGAQRLLMRGITAEVVSQVPEAWRERVSDVVTAWLDA